MLWILPIVVKRADVFVPLFLAASAPEALVARWIEVSEVVALTARVAHLGALTHGGARVGTLEAHARAVRGSKVADLLVGNVTRVALLELIVFFFKDVRYLAITTKLPSC